MQAQALSKPDSKTGSGVTSPDAPDRPPTILVVEDESMVRDIIMRVLQRAGYRVLSAADGQQAIQALDQPEIDLIITDLYMPQMDGMELVLQLRQKHPTIPIIAMSGSLSEQNPDMLRSARLLGARMTLAKPFEMQELIAAVSKLTGAPVPAIVP